MVGTEVGRRGRGGGAGMQPMMWVILVHPFPRTMSSPPHLSPIHGSQGHQVPLPSPEGCGPSPLMGEYARGRGTKGRPKKWETQAVRHENERRRKSSLVSFVSLFWR